MKYKILPFALLGLAFLPMNPLSGEEKKATFTMTTDTPADVKAAPEDAEKTASGLASKVLKKGTGTEKPVAADTVTVHYSGWTTDGKMFDSSVKRGEPTSFPLGNVIPGWTEGLQLMTEGEIRRFWIPAKLAYGETPRPGAPAGMLVFDVELITIKSAPKATEDTATSRACSYLWLGHYCHSSAPRRHS